MNYANSVTANDGTCFPSQRSANAWMVAAKSASLHLAGEGRYLLDDLPRLQIAPVGRKAPGRAWDPAADASRLNKSTSR
ncbi:hypothetical protein [Novipirellula caenicola]|uniref:Uncharacterized protein n=1 Tax=Novipirellula caenicola TaxID=1536901 RepID=A0ABP9VN40_9BACT